MQKVNIDCFKNYKKMLKKSLLFLIIVSSFNHSQVFADAELPSINNKFVKIIEENPTRDAGFVVGDILDRKITLTIKKPYELVKESLPITGYEHRYKGQISGIELVSIKTDESNHSDSVTYVLHLSYQVFMTGKLAKPAALRAEIIKIRNPEKKEVLQYRIPSFSFRISPLSVFGAVKLKEEMSPFVAPLLLDASKDQFNLNALIGVLAISLIGLLYIFGVNAWLPRMGAPFAKAYRDVRKLADTPEGIQQAVARVHQSLNKTAGSSLFKDNLENFISQKPAFLPAKKEIEQFFNLSRFAFFEANRPTNLPTYSKKWLLELCRHLRDCERGLVPNVESKKDD